MSQSNEVVSEGPTQHVNFKQDIQEGVSQLTKIRIFTIVYMH